MRSRRGTSLSILPRRRPRSQQALGPPLARAAQRRSSHRVGWAIALFAPLAAVAVLGGLELRRQSNRAADAVQQQAAAYLRAARVHFEQHVQQRATEALRALRLTDPDFAGLACAAVDGDACVLDLLCVDGRAQLVWPRLPLPREHPLPFSSPPQTDELRLAEYLLQVGGAAAQQRARVLLQRCAQRRQLPAYERARAAFRLGGVLRQLGDADAAEDAWLDARLAALESDASPIGIDLLTRLAIAELRGDHTRLAELAREIAANTWFAVPDELTGAVFARALAALAAAGNGSGPDPGWADLRAREEARRSARRFAAEFDRFAAPALQRVLDDAPTGPVFRSIGNGSECSLLALRPTTAEEQAAAGRGARWLGLRFDLAGLVTEALDELLDPGKDGYRLAVFDPDDEPIVGGPLPDGASAPELPALGGLILRAVPVDPEAILRDERLAVRNRVLILTALLALALGSGLLLVRSVAREAELAKLKVEFVSRMSHELKTPLALIRMYGETLALGRAAGPEQTAQFGGIVAREADRLTGQIDRILAFSQQQSGTLRYAPRPADLRALVADVLARYRDHVEQHGCTLVAEVDGDPLPVAVDANAFHLALAGLIENSVKYTAAGEPDREIVVTVGRAGDAAEVAVHDRGIGIPEGERERVFEAFYRASNAGEVRGAGLGLAQVRHFAHAHGGEVVALARDGGGTTLRLRLPLQPAGEESPDPT